MFRSVVVTEDICNVFIHFVRSAQSFSGRSSSSGSLLPEMMESETPPLTSSPNKADDSEVSSRRVPLDQGKKRQYPKVDLRPSGTPGLMITNAPDCLVHSRQ